MELFATILFFENLAAVLATFSLLVALVSTLALLYGIFWIVSLPLRRQERARFFLDLVETGLNSGHSIEQTVTGISRSRESSVGVRFHLLAAHIESGLRADQALEKVPRLLPPQIRAMLQTGARLGDIRKVLPACRRLLKDSLSQTRGALNYLLILLVVLLPILPVVAWLLRTYVFPQFRQIMLEMGSTMPKFTALAMNLGEWFILLQFGLLGMLAVLLAGYVGGPRLTQWSRKVLGRSLPDRWIARLPWRQKRLQRDFAGMLALLLDAEVPEEEALKWAAHCTDNQSFIHAAEQAATRLRQGETLPQTIRQMGCARELSWRLENAARGSGRFRHALSGWLDVLDAKSFQQEQAAAHLLTTAVILINGCLVAIFVLGTFLPLIYLIQQATLW